MSGFFYFVLMKNLWSSWRNEYISSLSVNSGGCFLCNAVENGYELPELVYSGKKALIIMNKYPYNNGHLLVSPKRHLGDLTELSEAEYSEINKLILHSVNALKALYNPGGINIGLNMGEAAGAGVPGHLHYHILPRWSGDTNFMMTVADVKVVSEAMEKGSAKLREYFKENIGRDVS